MTGKYLITTDGWFVAPNGKKYCAVWGEVEILEDTVLGVKTNRNSSNWYVKVGNEVNHVIVAGCQVHYAIKSDKKPNTEDVLDYSVLDRGFTRYERPTEIYIAE